jgi:hypothetical protein
MVQQWRQCLLRAKSGHRMLPTDVA